MPPLVRLAMRNLVRQPWRAAPPVLGVALGIAAVLATLSVGDNVRANIRSALEAAAGRAQLLVAPGAGGRAVFALTDAFPLVQETAGVARARAVLEYRAEPLGDVRPRRDTIVSSAQAGFLLSGRETEYLEDLPASLILGALPQAGSSGIALGAGFAGRRGLELGDTISFATPFGAASFTVSGLLDDTLGLASTNGGRVAILHLHDLQEAVRLSGRVSFLEIIAAPGETLQELRERLSMRLGEGFVVTLPAIAGDITSGVIDTISSGLQALALTLLALGGFLVYNSFAASVVERRRDYALLRTVCLTRAQVQRLALLEALFVSLAGALLGPLLGVLLSLGLTQLNALTIGFEFRTLVVPVRYVVAASLVGTLVAVLAAFLPARSASLTSPLAASRALEAPSRWRPLGWLLLGLGCLVALSPWQGPAALVAAALAMTLIFAGLTLSAAALLKPALLVLRPLLRRLLGLPGELGAGFTRRHEARNGVAIGAVAIGMALTIGVGAWVAGINRAIQAWVDTTIVGDLFVRSAVGFPPDFAEEVRAHIPEIDTASGVGVRVVRFEPPGFDGGRSVSLVLVEPERFHPETGFGRFHLLEGDAFAAYQALQNGELLASGTILDRFGVGLGNRARVRTREGFREFPVGGVIVDFTGAGEAFVGSLDDLARFGGGAPDLFVMTLQEGEPDAVAERLREAFPELYLEISSNEGYRERILSLTRRSLITANSLLLLAVFVAALGVANTLGMNLSGRRHEVAVLRSLGLSRGDVRNMVVAEGMVLVVLGAVLGVAAGILLAQVLTAASNSLTGYRVDPGYPWRLILLALFASPIVGLFASLLPAWRAARLAPVAALRGS